MTKGNGLSIILPVFNCAECLETLYDRLFAVLSGLDISYELILVEDCGTDNAWQTIIELARRDHRIRAYRHARNYGQHSAIATGLMHAVGEFAIVMDADLQDPPELVGQLLERAHEGADIVLSVRSSRQESGLRLLSSSIARKLFPLYSRFPNGRFYGTISLMSSRVVAWYLEQNDRHRYYLKVLDRYPGKIATVPYDQGKRFEGRSSYSLVKLIRLFVRLLGPDFWLKRSLVFLVLSACLFLFAKVLSVVVFLISLLCFSCYLSVSRCRIEEPVIVESVCFSGAKL